MSFATFLFRAMCARSDRKRDKGLTTPPDIERYDDISYGPHGRWNRLDVYRPKGIGGRLPVIVSFHGGGWIYGTKEVYQYYCMSLAQRGFAVINYNYRLAPRCKFPDPLEDTNNVFAWMMRSADKYGFDTGNIFAVGDSAGAMGIALYACAVTDPAYAARYAFTVPEGLGIKGLGLNCGVYTSSGFDGRSVFIAPERFDETVGLMDVVSNVTGSFPPSFVLTATGDFLLDQPEALTAAFDRLGVKYESRVYGDEENKPKHVFHCDVRSDTGRLANDEQCAFFRSLTG